MALGWRTGTLTSTSISIGRSGTFNASAGLIEAVVVRAEFSVQDRA
jgi:hypothetical protein